MGVRPVLLGTPAAPQHDVKPYIFEEVEMDCCCVP